MKKDHILNQEFTSILLSHQVVVLELDAPFVNKQI